MEEKVFSILKKYIKKGETVIAGVSGGPDSMAMLHFLAQYASMRAGAETFTRVIAAHVNHGLRGKASDLDEKLVRETAQKYGFIFEAKKLSLQSMSDLENLARNERRKFFGGLKEKYGAKWVIIAHHADDNTESIVLHFLRGSGPAGLAGMQTAKDGYLRPLLAFSKKEILAYAKQKKIPYRIDRTNRKNVFSRNLLRNKIFPLFEKINPNFKKTISNNAEIFRALDQNLTYSAEKTNNTPATIKLFRRISA